MNRSIHSEPHRRWSYSAIQTNCLLKRLPGVLYPFVCLTPYLWSRTFRTRSVLVRWKFSTLPTVNENYNIKLYVPTSCCGILLTFLCCPSVYYRGRCNLICWRLSKYMAYSFGGLALTYPVSTLFFYLFGALLYNRFHISVASDFPILSGTWVTDMSNFSVRCHVALFQFQESL